MYQENPRTLCHSQTTAGIKKNNDFRNENDFLEPLKKATHRLRLPASPSGRWRRRRIIEIVIFVSIIVIVIGITVATSIIPITVIVVIIIYKNTHYKQTQIQPRYIQLTTYSDIIILFQHYKKGMPGKDNFENANIIEIKEKENQNKFNRMLRIKIFMRKIWSSTKRK